MKFIHPNPAQRNSRKTLAARHKKRNMTKEKILVILQCMSIILSSCNSETTNTHISTKTDENPIEVEALVTKKRAIKLQASSLSNIDSVAGLNSLLLGIKLKDVLLTYKARLSHENSGVLRVIYDQEINGIKGLNLYFIDSVLYALRYTPPYYINFGNKDTTFLFALKLKYGECNKQSFEDLIPYNYEYSRLDTLSRNWVNNAYKRIGIWEGARVTLEYSKDSIVGFSEMAEYDTKTGFHSGPFKKVEHEVFIHLNDYKNKYDEKIREQSLNIDKQNQQKENEDRKNILLNY